MKYDYIIIDIINLINYFLINKSNFKSNLRLDNSLKDNISFTQYCIKNSILKVETWQKELLSDSGVTYLLFDSYPHKVDIRNSFAFINENFPKNRKKEFKELYNISDIIKYYFQLTLDCNFICQVNNLRAEDLIKPIARNKTNCLLISSNPSWEKYVNDEIDLLNSYDHETIESKNDILEEYGLNSYNNIETSVICFNSIFGNIPANINGIYFGYNEIAHNSFLSAIEGINDPHELIIKARKDTKNIILQSIKNNENQFSINVHLISPKECEDEILRKNLISGKNNITLIKILREVLNLDPKKNTFKFGGVKRPRL